MKDGKHVLSYVFRDGKEAIFIGQDYRPSPLHALDSDATMAGLLRLLSLRPDITNHHMFADYTPKQLAWAESDRAEDLLLLADELDERGEFLSS